MEILDQYHTSAMQATPPTLDSSLFRPGQQVGVAVSGGADSVGLLRRLLEERQGSGILLSVVHVHHGIRGVEADEDAAFVEDLAAVHGLTFHLLRTDAPAAAETLRETLEEAARNLRYAFFQQLMADGKVDAVATAHTIDDQAETVLHKLVRGAWTEGLSGIHPVLAMQPGSVLRPFLGNTHAAIEAWLRWRGQSWREDASNQDMAYTRNRVRHQLLPMLRTFNPQITGQLARLASISADEETYWTAELGRLLPALLLSGRPTRGGGRSASTHPEEETVAFEQARLRELQPAVARRVLRAAARKLGARVSFEQTEQLLAMAGLVSGAAATEAARPARLELTGGVTAVRSPREISLMRRANSQTVVSQVAYPFLVPGEVQAPAFGIRLRGTISAAEVPERLVTLRGWKAGDRVTIRHSRGPKKVSQVLDRLHIAGDARKDWPVVESEGTIIWMRGVDVAAPGIAFQEEALF